MMIKNDWKELLEGEFAESYYQELFQFLKQEYESNTIYPAIDDIFQAFNLTSYHDTKVVILGQDPYHGAGQAHGLSFSVKPGVNIPPSLKNIFKELRDDIGCETPNNGYLVPWAEQGVLLLNTVLTVRAGEPASHQKIGWERFTDKVIHLLNKREKPVIFVLWGRQAEAKKALITATQHHVLQAPHPSPFSAKRGFFGSCPFSTINQLLKMQKQEVINWQIPTI
ncbi:uracil-DNA glycosylase [Halalkalibacter urbisdiaboli]|uniref:uracil-DNA glycosylase n=1 Tax=Halalkalibacter urbisdiaboli TaxID=1960589 RepID=UPI000B44485D|nr:uracil-DNA glycosylase [Halalkalibacter urbisdiaboli]